ncbi:hypothetical protein ACFSL6_23980 [Paenibacillus thailandensis]|uniref:Uncharacterized protein n=1 Tax=Paenibacillus thailandensis TaxID=393250 RepID=A0ABW5R2Y7_9BACL
METEIVRLFLMGYSLNKIKRDLNIEDQKIVLQILHQNNATSTLLAEQVEKLKTGSYSPFFASNSLGRSKLPEHRKRKIRQVRISDEELKRLGNPNSTKMRDMMFNFKKLEEFVRYLGEHGIELVPPTILHKTINPNDPFWKGAYEDNWWVFTEIVNNKRYWQDAKDAMKR